MGGATSNDLNGSRGAVVEGHVLARECDVTLCQSDYEYLIRLIVCVRYHTHHLEVAGIAAAVAMWKFGRT